MLRHDRAGTACDRARGSFIPWGSSLVLAAIVTMVPFRHARAQASASAPADSTKAAATLYDEAVRSFDAARYAESARTFLAADAASPNAAALESAVAAARRAGDHLLVATAARRLLAREPSDAALTKQTAQALADAERHLARVELDCSPAPCALAIDSESVAPGLHHVLPGTHRFSAQAPGGSAVEERASLGAGSVHRFELLVPTPPASTSTPAHADPPVTPKTASPQPDRAPRKPLPVWAFYASAGATGVLAIASIWSGVDAMNAAEEYRDASVRTADALDSVEARATRTDVLWVTTALAAGFTTYAGFALVDWDENRRSLRAGLLPGRAGLLVSGDLP